MKFQHPEIFYFLFLLIIPIIVHLFQLQKFVKVPFTNVAYLSKIIQDNRKSSRVKKWFILCVRSLLFLALLFTFSQPFLSNQDANKKVHTFIYLDNSLSIQSKGSKGILLNDAVKSIIEYASNVNEYSLMTNEEFYPNLDYEKLKETLIKVDFSPKQRDLQSILLKLKKDNSSSTNTLQENILISDFQNINYNMFTDVNESLMLNQLGVSPIENISIDSVYISNTNANTIDIHVVIRNQGSIKENIPIAIYHQEKLLNKRSVGIQENDITNVEFSLPKSDQLTGTIKITSSDTFSFDNSFYFYQDNTKKKQVLSIGKQQSFLSRIYTKDEFALKLSALNQLDYNSIPNQDVIILDELRNIPSTLSIALTNFVNEGGTLVCIPNDEITLDSYNNFLNGFNTRLNLNQELNDLKITAINFEHPLLENTFTKQVTNFEYPIVSKYYPISSNLKSTVLGLENGDDFLTRIENGSGNLYLFSSAISATHSNFQQSPLIVPVFFNFAKKSYKQQNLYQFLEEENTIDISVDLDKDKVLALSKENDVFIPLQRNFRNKVRITTKEQPKQEGFYKVLKDKDTVTLLAFNTPKKESLLNFLETDKIQNKNITISNSIQESLLRINEKNEVKWLWKWFLGLAIVSLLMEILILKFYKS